MADRLMSVEAAPDGTIHLISKAYPGSPEQEDRTVVIDVREVTMLADTLLYVAKHHRTVDLTQP